MAATNFNLGDLKTLHRLDHVLVDLMKGNRDFECPDIDLQVVSNRDGYKGNEIERNFTKKAQNYAFMNFVKYTAIGAFAGYAFSSRRPGAMMISVSLGSIVGSTFGVTAATIGIMRRQLQLEDSPVALESRYQLWKINPNHEWLNKYQDDVQRWNRMTYYKGTDAAVNHNQIMQHINQQVDKFMDVNKENASVNNMDLEEIQTQKRQKFYENRHRLGHRHEHNDDHLYDFSHEHNENIKQTNENDQYLTEFRTQEDKFIEYDTNDNIKWG